MANYQAVHRHCHDTKTALDAVNGCNPGTREEPDAVKVARPVLVRLVPARSL